MTPSALRCGEEKENHGPGGRRRRGERKPEVGIQEAPEALLTKLPELELTDSTSPLL